MGDALHIHGLRRSSDTVSVVDGKNVSRKHLVAPVSDAFSQNMNRDGGSINLGKIVKGNAGHVTMFLLKVATLEMVRRFSRAKCPFAWHGLQALQVLSYPPFKWLQRWAPFKGLVKGMQVNLPYLHGICTVSKSLCLSACLYSSGKIMLLKSYH